MTTATDIEEPRPLEAGPRPPDGPDPRATRATVIFGVLVAVGWCLYGLNDRALWLDEAISRSATGQLGETLDRTSGTMGLYYVILTGWTTVFGDSAVALRSLSVVFVGATAAMTYLLARRVVGQQAAVVAVLAVGLLPALTRYGQEARSYALTALIATASWYCLTRAVTERPYHGGDDDRSTRWWLALTLLSVLGVLSHGLFIVQVATQGASLLAARCWYPLRRFVPALGISGLMGAALFQAGAKDVANWIPPLSAEQFIDALSLLLGPTWATAVITGNLVAIGVIASIQRWRGSSEPIERWQALFPTMWAFGPLLLLTLISTTRPYLHPRYLVASLPAIALLLAGGVAHLHRELPDRLGRSATRWVAAAALLGILAMVAGQIIVRSEPAEDWRAAARLVHDHAEPADSVIFTQPDLKLAFDSAWDELSANSNGAPGVVYPERPLGQIQRFDPPPDPDHVAKLIGNVDRLWVIHRTMTSSGDSLLTRVLEWPAVGDNFSTAEHHRLAGGVHVILLERSPT